MDDVAGAWVRIAPDFTGFREELLAGIRSALAGVSGSVRVTADTAGARADLDAITAQVAQVGRQQAAATVKVEGAPKAVADVETVKDALDDLSGDKATASISIDGVPKTLADLAALKAGLTALGARQAWIHTPLAGGGNASVLFSGLTAAAAADKGGGGTGILAKLLWGGGGLLGIGAGAGSLASFAGLGPEHILMTALGLAGSAVGGLLGGGILAAGAAGKFGVGMGSDALVMSSTIADTKSLYTLYGNLTQAVQTYGASSLQASQAQLALNQQLTALGNTHGVAAEFGLARAAASLNAFWDANSSQARVGAAGVLGQGLGVARSFIPSIDAAAVRNFAIIGKDIRPLLAFMTGSQGHGIFAELEGLFAKGLPTGIHAFTQGFELFAKTIAYVAPQTGHLMRTLDTFFTKYNTGAGFTKWKSDVDSLITDFHIWEGLLKELRRVVVDLFAADKNTATYQSTARSILVTLTGMLAKLDAWERSTKGNAQLHNIFAVHKQEVLAMLALIPPLVSSLGHLYLTVAPALTKALTEVLTHGVLPLLGAIEKDPFGTWLIGLGLISAKLGLLKPLMAGVGGTLGIGGKEAGLAANTTALDVNTAALTRLTEVQGAGALAGAEGDAAAAGFFSKAGGVLGKSFLAVAALGLGYEIGTVLNREFGISTWLAAHIGPKAPANIAPTLDISTPNKTVAAAIHETFSGVGSHSKILPQPSDFATLSERAAALTTQMQANSREIAALTATHVEEHGRTVRNVLNVPANSLTPGLIAALQADNVRLAQAIHQDQSQVAAKEQSFISNAVLATGQITNRSNAASDALVSGAHILTAALAVAAAQLSAAAAHLGSANLTPTVIVAGTGGRFLTRAMGGPVMPGESAIVGEAGPELLHMTGSGGYVVPNNKLRMLAGGTPFPPGSQLAGTGQALAAAAARGGGGGPTGLTAAQQALQQQASSVLANLQSLASQGLSPLQQLAQQLNPTFERGLQSLVQQLRATEQVQLVSLANQMVAANKAALRELNQQLEVNQLQALAQQTTDIAQAMATFVTDTTTLMSDLAAAHAGKITDAANVTATVAQNKTKAIADASQTWVDTYNERFQFGIALEAAQAKVALDKLTAKYAAAIGADQLHAARVAQQQDAAVAHARANLDKVQRRNDSAVAAAQRNYDKALAGTNQVLQAQMQLRLSQAQATEQRQVARANAALAAAQAKQSSSEAQANAAVTALQGTAALAEAKWQALIDKLNAQAPGAGGIQIINNVTSQADPNEIAQAQMWEMRVAGVVG